MLAPFMKNPLKATLRGVTNDPSDPTVVESPELTLCDLSKCSPSFKPQCSSFLPTVSVAKMLRKLDTSQLIRSVALLGFLQCFVETVVLSAVGRWAEVHSHFFTEEVWHRWRRFGAQGNVTFT